MPARAFPSFQPGDLALFRAPLNQRYPGLVRVQTVKVPSSVRKIGHPPEVTVTWGSLRLPEPFLATQLRRVVSGKRRHPHEINSLLAPRLLRGEGWQVGEWVWLWVPEFSILIDGVLAQVTQVRRNRAWVDLMPDLRFAPDGRSPGHQGMIVPTQPGQLAWSAHEERTALKLNQGHRAAERARELLSGRSPERTAVLAQATLPRLPGDADLGPLNPAPDHV